MIGTRLGPYEIVEEIGKGGMATVYRAFQPSAGRFVAIKVIHRSIAGDPHAIERFQREAQLITRLEHPYLLPVYDYDGKNEPPYIVMRYLESGTLKDVLDQRALPLAETAHVMRQLGSALDYAHRQGVIHRDIKPSNVMVDSDGNTYLMDFGIARLTESSTGLTQTGFAVGTPGYMSPEQSMGVEVTRSADIYSLGVMFYEMLTGHVPYTAETPMAVVLKHMNDPIPSILNANPGLPPGLDDVVQRAMAKQADERYESAMDMADDITRVVGRITGSARPTVLRQAAQNTITRIRQERESHRAEMDATMQAFEESRQQAISTPPPTPIATPTVKPTAPRPSTQRPTVQQPVATHPEPVIPAATGPSTTVPPVPPRRGPNMTAIIGGIGALVIIAILAAVILGGQPPAAAPTPTPTVQATTAVVAAASTQTATEHPATSTSVPPTADETEDVALAVVPSETATVGATETEATATSTASQTSAPSDTPQPTATETLGPAVAQAQRDLVVRSGPGSSFPAVATAVPGAPLPISGISDDGSWYLVTLPDGTTGWLAASLTFVRTSGNMVDVPLVIPTETATLPASDTPAPMVTDVPPQASANVIDAQYDPQADVVTITLGLEEASRIESLQINFVNNDTHLLEKTVQVEPAESIQVPAGGLHAGQDYGLNVVARGGLGQILSISDGEFTYTPPPTPTSTATSTATALPAPTETTAAPTEVAAVSTVATEANVPTEATTATFTSTATSAPTNASTETAEPTETAVTSGPTEVVAALPSFDFSSNFESADPLGDWDFDANAWHISDEDGNHVLVGQGELTQPITILGGGQPGWLSSPDIWVRFRFKLDPDSNGGRLIFRQTLRSYLALEVRPGNVSLRAGGGLPALTDWQTERSLFSRRADIEAGQWHELLLWGAGTRAEVYIDQQLALIATGQEAVDVGNLMLQVNSGDGAVEFDDLEIQKPGAASSHFDDGTLPPVWSVSDPAQVYADSGGYVVLEANATAQPGDTPDNLQLLYRYNLQRGRYQLRLRDGADGALLLDFNGGNLRVTQVDAEGEVVNTLQPVSFYTPEVWSNVMVVYAGDRLQVYSNGERRFDQVFPNAPMTGRTVFNTLDGSILWLDDLLVAEAQPSAEIDAEATETASISETAAPTRTGVIIGTQRVNVRARPDGNSRIIGQVLISTEVPIFDVSLGGGWYEIQMSDGTTGWVASRFITPNE